MRGWKVAKAGIKKYMNLEKRSEFDPTGARMNSWLNKSQERNFPVTVELFGKRFKVKEGVFPPEVYPETEFYTGEILKYIKPGMKFLDMGCGAGVTGVMVASAGARVLSVDVNPEAVRNAQENAVALGVSENMNVIESDVFDKIPENSVFDIIYWNIPFHKTEETAKLSSLQRAIFDPGNIGLRKFVSGLKKFTKPGSVVLIGTSETLGDVDLVDELFSEVGLDLKEIARTIEDPDAPNLVSLELREAIVK